MQVGQLVIFLAISFTASPLTLNDSELDDKKLCGARTIYLAGESLSPRSMGRLNELIDELSPSDEGNSFAEMASVAESRGLKTLAVKTTLRGLMARKRPFACIAHLTRGHFVVLADANEIEVILFDPPRKLTLPVNTFESQWSGKCLLISNSELENEDVVQQSLQGSKRKWIIMAGILSVLATLVFQFRRTVRRAKR